MSSGGRHLKDEGSAFQAGLAGAFSGLTARFFTAPLDVVKIQLQIQPRDVRAHSRLQAGILHTVTSLYKTNGLSVFWRGNVSASWLYVVYNTAQFSVYRSTAPLMDHFSLPTALASTVGGALAGTVATATAYPFDLVRTRFAAQGSSAVYKSFRDGITSIYQSEGVLGFYRGLSIAICQNAPNYGIFFGAYETIRPILSRLALPLSSDDALAGALASGLAKTGTYPLDLIRKRVQMQGPQRLKFADGRIPEYQKGFWRTGKAIFRQEGLKGMYRGLTLGLIKSTPSSTISMWSYGLAMRFLERSG